LEVLGVCGRAKNRPMDVDPGLHGVEPGGEGDAVLGAVDGVQHQDLELVSVQDERKAVAAFEEEEGAAAQGLQGEAVARDTVGGIHGGLEV
jgi:hypothetical protein